jgi:polyhydroxyalkanoate synthesis regulator phasin
MNRKKKLAIVAGAAAAVAVAGGGAALAADALSREEQSQAVIDDAAKQLGVEPSELSDALRDALKNQIDEAVEAGKITTEQANALKERIDAAEVPLFFGGIGDRGGRLFGSPHFAQPHDLETAATFLGLTEAELRAELADGKSLADVAKAEGKSVNGLVQALVADAKKRLDEAVDAGRLTQAQADEISAKLEERITESVNREPGTWPGRRGPGFRGPGFQGRGFGARPDRFHGDQQDFQGPFRGPRA